MYICSKEKSQNNYAIKLESIILVLHTVLSEFLVLWTFSATVLGDKAPIEGAS